MPDVYHDGEQSDFADSLEMRHEAFARLLSHLLAGRCKFEKGAGRKDFYGFLADALDNPDRIGIRCIAMIYVVRPDLVGNKSMREIAKSIGVTRVAFNKHVVAFVEEFPAMKPARCFGRRVAAAIKGRKR